jgi:hypothetical protein
MTTKPATVNLYPINVTEFDTVSEALTVIPESLVLQWINAGWRNTQMRAAADAVFQAERKAYRKQLRRSRQK